MDNPISIPPNTDDDIIVNGLKNLTVRPPMPIPEAIPKGIETKAGMPESPSILYISKNTRKAHTVNVAVR